MAYAPPFSLNDEILTRVAGIAQKVGQVEVYDRLNSSPHLRKENRIRTIHSSLAIENNSLSLDQVTAVIEGHHVIAPARDILEVQNALAAYEAMPELDPLSMEDLLRAHGLLMAGLTPEAGRLRSGNVGVFDGDRLIHMGTPANYVPEVLCDLFGWLRDSSTHPLIKSCVFHYEFEYVHPFSDGNGRMGRLWQTLILSEWNQLFAWLPVETIVKDNQETYYAVLGESDRKADCTGFVAFMLDIVSAALDDALGVQENVGINDGINVGITNMAVRNQDRLLDRVRENPAMTVAQMAEVLGLSKRQVERMVADLKKQERLVRVGAKRNGRWEVR